MPKTWDKNRATQRIDGKIAELQLADIEIKKYVRDTDLTNLPSTTAYRVDGVHLYADILNLNAILHTTETEGETCHKRTLRFLNLHYRAVHRILNRIDAIQVDFHNQRLHSVVVKPYDDEKKRVHRAVATGQLIIDVLARTGEDADHPAADVRVGIDTGEALAVNNGRRGHREPLFLGEPANHAAKRASLGTATGIYLTNKARKAIGLKEVTDVDTTALTAAEIATSQKEANLEVTADEIVKEWEEDLKNNPIGAFSFSGHTPPFSTLDIETLSAANSRRQDAATVYADLDGFTNFVGSNIGTDAGAKHVVRTLHVLRSELDAVLDNDFGGRKVRFIGDCVHGLLAEGTAQTTEAEKTVDTMTRCASAMRSSFKLALSRLLSNGTNASSLGLAIGFEYGPMNVTRLGMKAELIRCSVSRGVITAEDEQAGCSGRETAMGLNAYNAASDAVRALFGESRKRADLDYDTATKELDQKQARAASPLLKAASAAAPFSFPARAAQPSKPAGFA